MQAERHQLLTRVERHRGERCRRSTLPELFAAQAARIPDAVAVACGG